MLLGAAGNEFKGALKSKVISRMLVMYNFTITKTLLLPRLEA